MKRALTVVHIVFIASILVFALGSRNSSASIVDPLSIQLIDGTGDSNTTVSFDIYNYGASDPVYYRLNSGTWTLISWSSGPVQFAQLSGNGGEALDFRVDVLNDGNEANDLFSFNSSDASLIYSGGIEAQYAENPNRVDPYYRTVQVNWTIPSSFKLDIVISNDVHDGFAPVPIPSAALLLGSGLLALIGFGWRKKAKRA